MTEPATGAWARFLAALPSDLAALHTAGPPPDTVPGADGRDLTGAELLGLLRAQTAADAGTAPRALRPDRAGTGMIAAAWRHTAYRQARAALVLLDAGLGVEAQANARACLEHAVAVQRLAVATDDGKDQALLEQIASQEQRKQSRQLDQLDRLDSDDEHAALLASARRQHDAARIPPDRTRPDAATVKDHFLALPHGEHLHSVYARLAQATHAGITGAAPYLLRALKDDQPVPAAPEAAPWAETALLLAWALWAADDAMRRFLIDGDDLSARHVPLFAALGLAPE